ncbi:hypothetical protein G7Y89_g9679 [Cudoniella acicularis]|uniref:histidine kinase n=1 Tax=Cudoniella acicularis TaxID=354080 RepID=A0A8H4RHX1_9HELO|nr:hypothetical protein G7Y89_g9679 [Cudoniella acicularis]
MVLGVLIGVPFLIGTLAGWLVWVDNPRFAIVEPASRDSEGDVRGGGGGGFTSRLVGEEVHGEEKDAEAENEESEEEGERRPLLRTASKTYGIYMKSSIPLESTAVLTTLYGQFIEIHEENIDLRSILSEVVVAFKEEALRRNLHIKTEDDQAMPQLVRGDPSGLRQVVSNLLANALQSSDGAHINIGLQHIKTTQTNLVIRISFTDHGIGLSEEHLDSIFQDFEQVLDDDESSTSGNQNAKEKGTKPLQIGLGLATVARFVRLHSGQISMYSEGEGEGTNVSITIPFPKALSGDFSKRRVSSGVALPTPPSDMLSSQASKTPGSASSSAAPLPTDSTATSSASPGSNMGRYLFTIETAQDDRPIFNILVAEDNSLNSRLLETRLKRRGHAVRVVVDVVDSMEATRMIREFEKEPSSSIKLSPRVASYGRISIVAVSASLSEQRVHEYVEIGFDGWILKPIDFQRLEAIITAIEDEQAREILFYGTGN